MKADFEQAYGADRDGNRGVAMWEPELDGSVEEREEIAEKICEGLSEDGEISLHRFNVTLTLVVSVGCRYMGRCDEIFVGDFDFNISPVDYMDLVIPMMLDEVDDDWGVDEMSRLLYLERDLIEAKYEGKELAQLTKAVEPFREAWMRDFLGEER